MIQDCLEKRSEEYKRWFESIPQQLKELKQKHEKERWINVVIQKSNNNTKKRNEQIMYDLNYKKYVR